LIQASIADGIGRLELTSEGLAVHLHRNLNQKQHIFAFQIAPVTAVKLLDSITSSRIIKGQFLHAKPGQYWMQINTERPLFGHGLIPRCLQLRQI
jgi:hypothetical protein